MRLLLDENVHAKLLPWLVEKGHDAIFVPKGTKNGKVIDLANSENRIVLTHDKDFSDVLRYPPTSHQGLILIRIHPPRLPKLQSAFERLFVSPPSEGFLHRLIILQETGYHIIS
jgi:hypothetical protein